VVTKQIHSLVPSYPAELLNSVSHRFLENLKQQRLDEFEHLVSEKSFPIGVESTLLRCAGAELTGSSYAKLREELAYKRIGVLIACEDPKASIREQEAAGLIDKLKAISPVYQRRVLEGKIEDEDLIPLLKRARQIGVEMVKSSSGPRELSATDIVSEFSRRNQEGAAVQHLRAYTMDGILKTTSGVEQRLVFLRLRPDLVRLNVIEDGASKLVLVGFNSSFWQMLPQRKPQLLSKTDIGDRLYLAEFINPLLMEDGFQIERLADGTIDGQKVFRISIGRRDGSSYVACIEAEKFHEISREYANGVSVRYSDFRDVGGVTFAFREERSDRAGNKGVLQFGRILINPGLCRSLFDPVEENQAEFFAFENALAGRLSDSGRTIR